MHLKIEKKVLVSVAQRWPLIDLKFDLMYLKMHLEIEKIIAVFVAQR
jgi:hypothetical protein